MKTRLPVNHYLHLREQGLSHERAYAHTVQRYNVTHAELTEALQESRRHHEAVASMLPPSEPQTAWQRFKDMLP